MGKKLFWVVVTWFAIFAVYIILAAMMPAINGLVQTSSASLQATSNMSNYPGSLGVVGTAPIWFWFVPGLVGIIATAIVLRQGKPSGG